MINKIQLIYHHRYDRLLYEKFAFWISSWKTYENLRSRITINYHIIEKGLSNASPRLGFGQKVIESLIHLLEQYINYEYPIEDVRFQTGLTVLKEYTLLHTKKGYPLNNELIKKITSLEIHLRKGQHGWYLNKTREEQIWNADQPFSTFALSRYSVRDFGAESLNQKTIREAIKIAMKTPSVCNRQPWKVIVLRDFYKIKALLEIQGGFRGNGRNIDSLVIILINKSYFSDYRERNQLFIDGWLFSMSLLYAFHHLHVAACMLNNCFDIKTEKKVRKATNIDKKYSFIMFMAIGSYPKKFYVARSVRDEVDEITEWR